MASQNANDQDDFVKIILNALSPMYNVVADVQEEDIALCKDGIIFAKIKTKQVFLLDYVGQYTAVEQSLLDKLLVLKPQKSDLDNFLFKATKAYWLACAQKNN